jgi:3-dehydroquinate synthase
LGWDFKQVRIIKVNLSQSSYEIQIGVGLLRQVGDTLKSSGFQDKAAIITNPAIRELYGNSLKADLEKAGFRPVILEVPEGEEHKSLGWAGKLYFSLSEYQAERMTPVLALGGGVIGDLAGFVAATYMRGVPLIQLPTSLLAQVDSSTGGKVAVDHGRLKNMIGSFYQPKLVIADISSLKTLHEKEFANGQAEVIKHGLILDRSLFETIESGVERLESMDEEFLQDVISRSIAIKAGVVEKDERDMGLRNILNYGHTVGHAIETASDLSIKHGSAVAIGMVAAGMISERMGILPSSELDRIISVISRVRLPVKIPGLNIREIMEVMEHDKKKKGGKIRFVLLKAIGQGFISNEVSVPLVERVLMELS